MAKSVPIRDPIAVLELTWVRPDGSQSPVTAKVGHPYLVAGTEWACPCALDGIDGAYPDIRGEGSLQALSLALGLLRQRLVHVLSDGGHLLDRLDGQPFDRERLAATFGRQLGGPR